jgi:DNA-binding NarL/FixJ family response regulator
MPKSRVFIADDHTLLVDAFRKLLEPEFEIVGTAEDGRELIEQAPKVCPDLAVVDLGLPRLNGIDAGRELKRLLPRIKILVVTVNEDSAVAREVLRQWASGYLLKKSSGTELTHALRELVKGRSYVTPIMAQKVAQDFIRDPDLQCMKLLTQRQREVLQLLAEGRTMKEAADILSLTTRTIAFHKYRIMEDFGMRSNSELLKLAMREHLIAAF